MGIADFRNSKTATVLHLRDELLGVPQDASQDSSLLYLVRAVRICRFHRIHDIQQESNDSIEWVKVA